MKNISLLTIIFVGSIFLTTFADTITSFSIDGVKIGDSEFKTKENMPAPSSVKMLGRHQPNLYRYLRESGPVQIQYSSDKVYSIRGKGLKRGKSLILWEGVNLSRVRKILGKPIKRRNSKEHKWELFSFENYDIRVWLTKGDSGLIVEWIELLGRREYL